MELQAVLEFPSDVRVLSVLGRDVRVLCGDQVVRCRVTASEPLAATLALEGSFRADPVTAPHRPEVFTSCCHFYGHSRLGVGRAPYCAVAAPAGPIRLLRGGEEMVAAVDTSGQQEIGALVGLASTPAPFHLDHPEALHETDGTVLALNVARTELTVWSFRTPTAGRFKPVGTLGLSGAALAVVLLPCSDWVAVAFEDRVEVVRWSSPGSLRVAHRCSHGEPVVDVQPCSSSVLAVATTGFRTAVTLIDIDADPQGPRNPAFTISHPSLKLVAMVVVGRHPRQHIVLATGDSIWAHPLDPTAPPAPPLFALRPRPVNLTGTAHADQIFPLYGRLPLGAGVTFAPIDVAFDEDPPAESVPVLHTSEGTEYKELRLPSVVPQWTGVVKRVAYSHPLGWLLVVSTANVLYALGPNPLPLLRQWNRAPAPLLRPLLERALRRMMGAESQPTPDHALSVAAEDPPPKRRYRLVSTPG